MVRKAQVHSLDFIIGMTIFILIFLSIASLWNQARLEMDSEERRQDIEMLSRYALESLILTSGEPYDWYNKSALDLDKQESLGLSTRHAGVLSEEKIKTFGRFNASHYNDTKIVLGMRGAGYEYYMNISLYDESMNHVEDIIVGYTGECTSVVKIERIAPLKDSGYAKIEFMGCIA